ncbi:MAG: UDP-3-O-(3-hydroxymyristoyl)glucosamine N-acyltransferase [Gemmatimonadota bacterium]
MDPHREGGIPLAEAARLVGGELRGEASRRVRGVAPLGEGGPGELEFLASRKYLKFRPSEVAAGVLVQKELAPHLPPETRAVVVEDAYAALRTLLEALYPTQQPVAGVHPTAVLGRGVHLGEEVTIGPFAVLEDGVRVGARARIGAHAVVGRNARVGADSVLHPQVVLYPGVEIGERVILHAGARIGVDGFGWVIEDGTPRRIPHVGGCVVGDDVEIGANTTVDRGTVGPTRIGAHAKLDNLVQLAHNVRLGARSLLAALVGVAGSTRVGRGVLMGGQSGAADHLDIGDGARVAGATKVFRDVPPGEAVSGNPARPNREYLRKQAMLSRLPALERRLSDLERRLGEAGGGRPPDDEEGDGS